MANVKRKNKKDIEDYNSLRRNAGIAIILIVCACFILLICGGTIWSQNINFDIKNTLNTKLNNEVDIDNIKNEISKLNDNKLFDATYYDAFDNISDLAYNTKWLEMCPNSQTKINNELYVKVCDNRFLSVDDVLLYYENILSKDLTSEIIKDKYINYKEELYVKPFIVDKDETYVGIESYSIKFKTNDKISYIVKSKYRVNENDFEYKEHTFEIIKNDNIWVVSRFDLPL